MTLPELPPEGMPLPGSPRYVLRQLLGRGGFGDAYLAEDQALTRQVVIKMLMNLSDATVRDRFMREARIAANIKHANVVQVFDIGALPDGQPYYIMEFIEGQSMTDYIRRHTPVRLSAALTLIAEAAEGLHAAHRLGVVHRDVKPDNILVTIDGHAKVIDFGIAKKAVTEGKDPTTQATAVGQVPGTPRYLSPEQAQAKAITSTSDLYSLGCVMYTTLTGKSPFDGTPYDMMRHHVFTPPPTLAASGCGVSFPTEVEEIVARLLAKKPEDRFQSGEELARALRRAAQRAREREESDVTEALAPIVAAPAAPSPTASSTVSAVSMNVAPAVSATAPAVSEGDHGRTEMLARPVGPPIGPMAAPMMAPTTPVAASAPPRRSAAPLIGIAAVVVAGLAVGGVVLARSFSNHAAATTSTTAAAEPPRSTDPPATAAPTETTPAPKATMTAEATDPAAKPLEPPPSATTTKPSPPESFAKSSAKPAATPAPTSTIKTGAAIAPKPSATAVTTAKPATAATAGAADDQY